MPQVPAAYLQTLTDAINSLTSTAKTVAMQRLNHLLETGEFEEPVELVEALLDVLEPVFEVTNDTAASLSANTYDLLRMSAIDAPMGALPYSAHDLETTRRALYGIAEKHKNNMEAFALDLANRLDREAKVSAAVTMTSNGSRDRRRPKFARVPQGAHTCPFCLMLASRGFDYYDEKSAGAITRFHDNCDCKVVPQWGGESYEGYDPDAYYEQYQEMLRTGELNTEQLNRASERARERRRAERR